MPLYSELLYQIIEENAIYKKNTSPKYIGEVLIDEDAINCRACRAGCDPLLLSDWAARRIHEYYGPHSRVRRG